MLVLCTFENTQVTNNHVREFRSMPLPSRTLRSNLVTLVWLVVPIWNPIALSLSSRLGSSQVVETWQYTRPGPSPWKACALGKETKVGQAPLGFPIVFWSWHSVSWLVENCVFSWCTCTPGTQEFDALEAYGVVVSSPFANKVRFSSVLRGRKIMAWLLELF